MTDNESKFEKLFENEIPEDGIVKSVTPFKRGMSLAIIGIAISCITVGFDSWVLLRYLHLFVGVLVAAIGFRYLKGENKWFSACYLISLLRLVYASALLVVAATWWHISPQGEQVLSICGKVMTVSVLGLLICFRQAVKTAGSRVGGVKLGSFTLLILWYLLVCLLGFIEYDGTLVIIALIIVYINMIRGLIKVLRTLDEAGYDIKPVYHRIPNKILAIIVTASVTVCVLIAGIFGQHYPTAWTERDKGEYDQLENIIDFLVSRDIPRDVVNTFTREDIHKLKEAKEITVSTISKSLKDDKVEMLTIVVRLKNDASVIVIHYFNVPQGVELKGVPLLRLLPAWIYPVYDWTMGKISGRVVGVKDGVAMEAEYSVFRNAYAPEGSGIDPHLIAGFSVEDGMEQIRGYLMYSMDNTFPEEDNYITAYMEFCFDRGRMLYPYSHPFDRIRSTRSNMYYRGGNWTKASMVFEAK